MHVGQAGQAHQTTVPQCLKNAILWKGTPFRKRLLNSSYDSSTWRAAKAHDWVVRANGQSKVKHWHDSQTLKTRVWRA